MKIKLIKLIQNELIKIFKRKSIYILLLLSLIAVIIHNYDNPDQNPIFSVSTFEIPINESKETESDDIAGKVKWKAINDFSRLYNKYDKDSWQRYALNEERTTLNVNNKKMDFSHDIQVILQIISDYEMNEDSELTTENYENAKRKYDEYAKALDDGDWKEYTNFKIKNLTETKNSSSTLEEDIKGINLEIEAYQMRLDYNIGYADDIPNQYIERYKEETYQFMYEENRNEEYYKECKAKSELAKYAIKNGIKQDISPEKFNLIFNNQVDARISFIRTFRHFDLIIVIIAIYIATTILTEETNKRTIKSLLTKPHKRSTILISKLLACVITIIITMLFLIVAQYIVGGIRFGYDSYELKYIGYDFNNEQIINMNLFSYIVLVAITKLPMYIIIILFCILMGVINNHTAMTMILTLIIFLIFNIVIAEWSKVEMLATITRFLITNNWDFSTYLLGETSDIKGITLSFSVVIYLIYMLLLLLIIIKKFNKREINNI